MTRIFRIFIEIAHNVMFSAEATTVTPKANEVHEAMFTAVFVGIAGHPQ